MDQDNERPAALALSPVTRRRVSDDVRARLEAAIRSGRLSPGDKLPSEREMMSMMGVGRPAVRDALTALARLGLVSTASGGRTRVSQPTPHHLLHELGSVARHLIAEPGGARHFEQARTMTEVGIARWAAQHAVPGQLARLAAALDRNEAAIGNQARFVETDVAFHRTLVAMPGNPVLLAMHDAAVEWLIRQRPPLAADPAPNNRMSHTGHAAIVQAVRRRDPEAAAASMQQHLDDAYVRYSRN